MDGLWAHWPPESEDVGAEGRWRERDNGNAWRWIRAVFRESRARAGRQCRRQWTPRPQAADTLLTRTQCSQLEDLFQVESARAMAWYSCDGHEHVRLTPTGMPWKETCHPSILRSLAGFRSVLCVCARMQPMGRFIPSFTPSGFVDVPPAAIWAWQKSRPRCRTPLLPYTPGRSGVHPTPSKTSKRLPQRRRT